MFSHNKRYLIISGTWNFDKEKHGKTSYRMWPTKSYDEFDTLEEVKNAISILNELYENIEHPTGIEESKYGYINIPEGSYCWGYVVIDFDECKIVEIGGDGHENYKKEDLMRDTLDRRRFYDIFFRMPGEIPEGYKWDNGEYEGWLQYRWGDGKNAIGNDYKIIKKIPSKKIGYNVKPIKHNKNDKKRKVFFKEYDGEIPEETKNDLIQDELDKKIDNEIHKEMMNKF